MSDWVWSISVLYKCIKIYIINQMIKHSHDYISTLEALDVLNKNSYYPL